MLAIRSSFHELVLPHSCLAILGIRRSCVIQMPYYCLFDCHYFYRSALRLLSIASLVSPLYA